MKGILTGSVPHCLGIDEMRRVFYDNFLALTNGMENSHGQPVLTIGTCMRVFLHTGDASSFDGAAVRAKWGSKDTPATCITADQYESVAVWLHTIETCENLSIRTFTASSLIDLA